MSLPLLLTRPRHQAEEFAITLEAALPGRFDVVAAPLIETVSEEASIMLDGVQALLFSSANAVREFAARTSERHLPALCVGDKTAQTASALGFGTQSAQGDVAALAELAAISYLEGAGHYLYLRGRQSAGDLSGSLLAQGIMVDEAVLYHQDPVPLSPQALALLAQPQPVVAPVFSPNAGHRLTAELAACAHQRQAPLAIVAISQNAASACAEIPGAEVYVAPQPDAIGILSILSGF